MKLNVYDIEVVGGGGNDTAIVAPSPERAIAVWRATRAYQSVISKVQLVREDVSLDREVKL